MRIKFGGTQRQDKTSEGLGRFGNQKMLDKAKHSCGQVSLIEDSWEAAT